MHQNNEAKEFLGRSYRADEDDWDEEAPDKGWLLPTRRLTSRSRVLMYADEDRARSNLLADVEVLASAPADGVLPDNFTSDDVKYGDFRKKNFRNSRYIHSSRWNDQFRRIRIYASDPKSIYVASKQCEDYAKLIADGQEADAKRLLNERMAWETLKQDPHTWMHAVDLKHGEVTYAMANIEKFFVELERRMEATRYSQVNARRLVLRSQALNDEIMRFNPCVLAEDGLIKFRHRSLPMVRLARSIDAKMVYDGEFGTFEFPELFRGQQEKETMVRALGRKYELPRASDGLLMDWPSRGSQPIMLAGIAAGLAREMYGDGSMRTELLQIFEVVWLNGRALSR